MKKIYIFNNSKGVIGTLLGLKSRITSIMPALYQVITPMLFVAFGLFGVNESAWAYWTTDRNGNAQADNASIQGYVSKSGSTYYVLDDATERSISPSLLGTHVEKNYNINGPAATLTFQTKKSNWKAVGNLKVAQRVIGGGWTDKYDNNPGTSYEGSGNIALDEKAVELSFYNDYGSYTRYFKDVKVTMASYFVLEKTSIAFGEADVNTANVSERFKIYWSNIAAKAITKTGDTDRFNVNITSVPSQAGYYGNTVLTITYKHDVAGSHSMTMTVNGQTITVTGTTNKLQPTVKWSTNDAIFIEDDELSATNANGLTVTLSSAGNESYVRCEGNTATMLAPTAGTITITAHVEGNNIYADKDFTKDITITNLEKQTITWNWDFSRLKTTDSNKTITLSATSPSGATASSGLPVSYELVGDKTGLTLTQNGDTWTLTYSASECKNTTIIAKQAGNGTYAPASSVSKTVKVIDPTKVCDESETLVNSNVKLKENSVTYNIDIPDKMYVSVSRTKQGLLDIYLVGVDFEFYSGKNGTGKKLYTKSYGSGDIDKSISNSEIDLSSYINAKSVKVVTTSSNGYNINKITYTHQKYCNLSDNSLAFSTYPSTTTSEKKFTVNYANYPISLECSNSKFAFTPTTGFGDCGEYGSQEISVTYTAGADEGNDVGYLYIKDNTGATLKTCTLNVTISKVAQSITSHTIGTAYKTTDRIELSAIANSNLTAFEYSASPAGVASFDGNVMTFSKSGTIAVTVTQPGNNVYAATSATVNNVVVNKVSPNITNPTGKAIEYRSALKNSTWEEAGVAKVTLRGVPNTVVAGSFGWNDPEHVVMDAVGEHSYKATFTPSDGGMYNNVEFDQTITILRTAQTLEMNNGAVKIAVDGIDAGKPDSKIDLDDLIKAQTGDVINNVKRDGVVTYEVISENEANADIAAGNIFSARVIGDYRIRATKAQTDWYNEVTDEFTVTVSKRANTMTISNTAFERFVDQEVTNVRDVQNSDAEVQTSSDFPTIAYYDVANNKIVIPNSESDYQMFGSQKTVTIKIWQEETERFEASGEKTITLTVKKYETTKSGEDITLKVNETVTGNYSFTNTSAEYPSNNLNDDFYYTIDAPSFDNEALNNGDQLITYNPSENEITGHNAGTTKITFFQKETYKYTGATLMCNVTVEKRDNQLSNSWGNNVWQKAMNESASLNVSFTSTHGDYANYPISIDRIYGEDVATLTGDAAGATITTNTTKGYAIWHVSQAENYEYYSAEADVIVTVGVPAPPTCYVYQDNSEHEFGTGIGDAEGHFESPIAINSPVDKIWFNAKRQLGGFNNFVVQYSKDNGKNWSTLLSPSLDTKYKSSAFSATFPTMQGTERITHVRFGAKTGATLSKWYKDVKISRRAYLNLLNAEQNKISKLPTMMCTIDETSSSTAKFYIDCSTCADEIIIESSNPEYFTVSRSSIDVSDKHDNLTSAKEEITVTYSSTELGIHNAVITVHTSYQTRALSVSGETTKRTPTLTWQEGYTNNPLTLPVGLTVNALHPAATSTSGASVNYTSSDESVVEIIDNGLGFRVIKAGSAILTAKAPENAKWKEVSDTRVINATDKIVQEIVWNQSFPRFMEPGDVIDLDAKVYLRNLTTNALVYSAERTPCINYTCPTNNGVVTVSGNKMTVLGYGEVKVTASVGGNADYAAAASVIMLINVRQPSVGCETPLVLNRTDIIDMFEVNVDFSSYTNLTTEEMVSDEVEIDHTYGKPDKLSFSYEGEEYAFGLLKFFGGFIKFEQHVNGNWIAVTNSRVETVKNEWNTKSNLQLDENADALRIIREQGGTGHHYIKDIQVTRKQYLRETNSEINLGEIKIGQATPVTIGFDYSDVKGDLTARTINNTTDLTIKDNGVIDLECGSFGHYDLQVTFTPSKNGDWQGTVEVYDPLTSLSITVGLTATVTASEEYIFEVAGEWNNSTNWTTNLVPDSTVNITVAENMTINSAASVKSITIEEGVTVTVKSGVTLQIGNGAPKSRTTYGNLHVEDGAQVIIKDGGIMNVNNFTLEASIGNNSTPASSGQVSGDGDLDVNGDVYFKVSFDPSGAITYGWYDFTVPFEVDVLNGVFDKDGNKLTYNVDYAVMEFSEEKRATNTGRPWIWFNGTMQPSKLYTITLDDEKNWNTFLFKKKAGSSVLGSNSYEASYSNIGEKTNRGWNGMGNGTLHYCQLNKLPAQTKIQVEDHANECYVEKEASDYTYAVGTAFFVQVPEEQKVDLTAVSEKRDFMAPARYGKATDEFRLALTAENAEHVADHLWVSASEEATGEYVIGRDLLKMGTPTNAKVAQMWSTNNGLTLCDIEMPLVNGDARCELGLYAPEAGEYTLAVERAPEEASLFLTYNNRVIWNLSVSPYTFDLSKGTTEGYGLRLVAEAPQMHTDIEETGADAQGVKKMLINNTIYIITPEGKMYDAVGKCMKY